ncbi:hypothetical protein Goshw_011428, partial [Gossypium schwendimanii]|nr:hypothetical protein [Gossypium schwendimanii]
MKLRILFMYFGIVSQLRKFGRKLSQVINSAGSSLEISMVGSCIIFLAMRGTLTGYWTHLFTKGVVARENGSAPASGVDELWGILDGLLVLLSKGFKRATIQTDNIDVVKALQDNMMANLENNLVADCLAKLSLAWKASLQIFENAPNEVLG